MKLKLPKYRPSDNVLVIETPRPSWDAAWATHDPTTCGHCSALVGDTPHARWARECDRAMRAVLNCQDPTAQGEVATEAAQRLLAVSYHERGIACPTCSGFGERAYSNTTTWRGGIGGQAITSGVCDRCWGTGRTDKTGPDLRVISDMRRLYPWDDMTLYLTQRGWAVQPIAPERVTWADGERRCGWAAWAWIGQVRILIGYPEAVGKSRACRIYPYPGAPGYECTGRGAPMWLHQSLAHYETHARQRGYGYAIQLREALASLEGKR